MKNISTRSVQLATAIAVLCGYMTVSTNPVRAQEMGKTISGVYDFHGSGQYRADYFSSPLFDFEQIKLSSQIEIADTGSKSVRVKFVRQDGVPVEKIIDLSQTGYTRQAESIGYSVDVPGVGARILPGKSIQVKTLTFRKDNQGNLQIVRNMVEKGWMLFLIPFSENRETTLTLQRAGEVPGAPQSQSTQGAVYSRRF